MTEITRAMRNQAAELSLKLPPTSDIREQLRQIAFLPGGADPRRGAFDRHRRDLLKPDPRAAPLDSRTRRSDPVRIRAQARPASGATLAVGVPPPALDQGMTRAGRV